SRRFDPGDVLNLARSLVLAGRRAEARPLLARARQSLPGAAADVLYLEGLVEKGDGHFVEAAEKFGQVTRLDPQLEAGWYQLGCVLFLSRAYRPAIEALEKVLALNPKHVSAEYKRFMAYKSLGEEGKADESKKRFLDLTKGGRREGEDDTAHERCRC